MEQTATSRQSNGENPIELLKQLKKDVFNDSNEQLALGLGRPIEEIEAWFDGSEEIDEDAEYKINGLAEERLQGDSSSPEAATDPDESIQQRL